MAEKRTTYKIQDLGGIGEVNIADEVVAIIAGLAAKGITEIEDIYHIERGYSCLDEKLRQVGADIQKVSTPVSTLREAL